MKWIKASEKLPEMEDFYYGLGWGTRKLILDFKGGEFYEHDCDPLSFPFDFKGLEWLDESGKEAPQVAVECYVPEDVKDKFECLLGYLKSWGTIYDRPALELPQVIAECEDWLKKTTLYTTPLNNQL